MADPTWDALAKNQIDPELISEYVAAAIVAHESDPEAHLGAGESLEQHKTNDVIDHPAESILNDKLHIPSRAYTAVVGSGALVDFEDIQDAIDFVSGVGGGSIYICSGTYALPNILTIPTNVKIFGQSRETVFIDCAAIIDATGSATFNPYFITGASASFTNGSKNVVGVGTNWLSQGLQAGDEIGNDATGNSGTIATINSNTSITLVSNWGFANASGVWFIIRYGSIIYDVVGSGTSWLTDGLRAGNFIKLNADGSYREIDTVISDTHLTLVEGYDDTGGTGACTTKILPFLEAGRGLSDYKTGTISVTQNSKSVTGSGTSWNANAAAGQTILINGAPYIIDTVNSNTSITLLDFFRGNTQAGLFYEILSFIENITLQDFNIINCEEDGAVNFRCVSNSLIENVEVHGCSDGFYLTFCNNVTIQRNDSSNNMFDSGASGMWIVYSTRCNILYNNFSGNYFHGIATQSANFFCNFIGNTCNNNGSGGLVLNALGTTGFGNSIIGNKCVGNKSTGLTISNTSHYTASDNVCAQNGVNGISCEKNNFCVIKGNQCFSNGDSGIKTFVTTNISSRCVIDSNVCYNNTTYGILIAAGCVKNIVTSNIIYSNGTNLQDSGTSTTAANNITS